MDKTRFGSFVGVSSRISSKRTFSNVPAHSVLFVNGGPDKLKIFSRVAGIEECSNCESEKGVPFGECKTDPFAIHGEISNTGTLTPKRSNRKGYSGGPLIPSGLGANGGLT